MASPPSVVLGPVTLGLPRFSVIAFPGPESERWSGPQWEALRESGVSVVCRWGAGGEPLPSIDRSAVAVGPDPAVPGVLYFDTALQFARYPEWAKSELRPWGPLLIGEHRLELARSALAAGAPLVAFECAQADELADLVGELRALASLVGRELTRVPKPAERPSRGLATAAGKRYGGRGPQRVAFQGEHGAFSEMAVFNLFSPESTAVPLPTFPEVFAAVLAGEVDFGMVPIENALAGPINENYDLLLAFPDLHIVGETQVRVEHNLIGLAGTPLEAIRRVFSHPQGLAQSRQFLDSRKTWEAVPFYDTAGAVKHVAAQNDPSLAAIASAEAARVYGLSILVPGVETNHRNFTRFFLIARPTDQGEGAPNKASLVFATADEPGALSRCLAVFSTHGVNMTKLESRPIHGRPWDYMFYVDVRLPADPQAFEATLKELGEVAKELRVLGVYEA